MAYDLTAALIAILGDYAPDDLTPGAPTPAAADAWAQLPELYRRADDGTLEALLTTALDITGAIALLITAIDYRPTDEGGTGELPDAGSLLVDPERTFWLNWLAQAVGVDLAAAGITIGADARLAVATPVNGWRAGSTAALEAAGRRTLTGAQTIRVRGGLNVDPFVITVSTAAAETPDAPGLEAAIRRVLPAGHDLELDNAVGSWAGIEALAPTWTDIELLTSAQLEELYA